jgi:hypothetical protein
MTEEEKNQIIASMYDQGEEEETENRQPEQLRLAGKAILVPHKGTSVALVRVEYVEALEHTIREQRKVIDDQNRRMRKLELRVDRIMNIADKRRATVESQMKANNSSRWDY